MLRADCAELDEALFHSEQRRDMTRASFYTQRTDTTGEQQIT